MDVRPLRPDDLDAVADVILAALPTPDSADVEPRRRWVEQRNASMLDTDPDGCWVAEEDGELTGSAMAVLRDGIWGLAAFGVRPDRHARGTGTRLLQAALTYADGARGGIICSSEDPRATRLYARAGFDLRPSVSTAGQVDRAGLPAELRARRSEDFEAAAALSRPVRGGAYGAEDLAMLAARPGFGLLLIGGRGFAIHHRSGSPVLLCARDDDAATDLFLSCLAQGPPGATVGVEYITAGQDWAIGASLGCRLAITAAGPLFTRGELGPLRPWLPSGSLL